MDHPARYSKEILDAFANVIPDNARVLDPMAGTGKIFDLENQRPDLDIYAVEIEPEWALMHAKTTIGNALYLDWPDGFFDAIAVSPAYGNRMADRYSPSDPSERHTYAYCLRRQLHEDNGGAIQWGDKYKEFHVKAWREALRVLRIGGVFVLNIKNHIRGGVLQDVAGWHADTLQSLGCEYNARTVISQRGMRHGANWKLRTNEEYVMVFGKVKNVYQ